MAESQEIVPIEAVRLGDLQVASAQIINRATIVAKELAKIVKDQKLYTPINNKNYVRCEGWTTMGGMLGILPREKSVIFRQYEGYEEYEATIELIRVSDGVVIGQASAICGTDEPLWEKRTRNARRSMSLTRAVGKGYRLGFSWIMSLAGYEPTPAEEMEGVIEGQMRDIAQDAKDNIRQVQANADDVIAKTQTRPYPPELVKQIIIDDAMNYKDFKPTPEQVGLLAGAIGMCFEGDPNKEDKRHTVLNYLTGCTTTKDVRGRDFRAILRKWLELKQDPDTKEYSICEPAIKEAQAIVSAALVKEGQAALL